MPGLQPLPPVERQSLFQLLQSAIKDYILDNGLGAGDPLPSESDLAEQLGVGRNSVREAIKSLEVLGIVEARTGSGLYVRGFSFDSILANLPYSALSGPNALSDSLDVRLLLELGVVDRVVKGRSEDQLARLGHILSDWKGEAEAGSYSADLDREFHRVLCSQLENPLLRSLIDVFWEVYQQAVARDVLQEPSDPWDTYQRHVAVFDALEAGDSEELDSAFRAHLPGIARRVQEAASRQAPHTEETNGEPREQN